MDEIKKAEQRGYAKGYTAGKKRLVSDTAARVLDPSGRAHGLPAAAVSRPMLRAGGV